jgi:SAM-dependent methyltransferase
VAVDAHEADPETGPTMTVQQRIVGALVRQAGHPRGVAGTLIGWLFAHRSSNRRRNSWAVSLLGLQPGDRALEVGFGPGRAIAELSRRVGPSGHVHGLDHSDVMLRQATRRNAAAVRAGRVTLVRGTVEQLPPALDGPFDAILAVNTVAFWPEPAARLADLRRRLSPGGRIAVVSQPRCPGATRDTSLAAATELTDLLRAAGFTRIRTEMLDLDPPAACALATHDDPDRDADRDPGARPPDG